MSSNQWTPINAPRTPQTTSTRTTSSIRRSARVHAPVSYPKSPLRNKPKRRSRKSSKRTRSRSLQTPISYPKTPLRSKPKRRTKESRKNDKSGGSSIKSEESVTKICRDLMDDLVRNLGPDSDGDVPMSDMSLNGDETEEEEWAGIGAAAVAVETVPTTKDKVQVQSHTRTRPSRPQTYSCRACGEPDNDLMVMCDDRATHQFSGEAWYHLACVGLTPHTQPGEVWYCPPCEYEKIFRAFG